MTFSLPLAPADTSYTTTARKPGKVPADLLSLFFCYSRPKPSSSSLALQENISWRLSSPLPTSLWFIQAIPPNHSLTHTILYSTSQHQQTCPVNNALNPRAVESENERLLQLKLHFGLHSLILGDISTPLSSIHRASRQKLNTGV